MPANDTVVLGANSGSCTVLFQAGSYSGYNYTIEAGSNFNGTLVITSEGDTLESWSLGIRATEMSLYVALNDLVLDLDSVVHLKSGGNVHVNHSSLFGGSYLDVESVAALTISTSTLKPDSHPPISITGNLTSILVHDCVASSDSFLILAEGTSDISITVCETNFVGPSLIGGSQPLNAVNITTSLLVGINPYLFSRNMDAKSLLMCGVDIQGAALNATLFPSQSRPMTMCSIDDFSPTSFALGNISAQNFVLANSTLWGPQGTLHIAGLTVPVASSGVPTSRGSPSAATSSLSTSSILVRNTQFLRILTSGPSLSIVGDNSMKQSVQFIKNSWNFSGAAAPDLGDLRLHNISSIVDFGSVTQVIPSLIYDNLIFTGTLTVSSRLIGTNSASKSMILAGDDNATLELYSIYLDHVNLTEFEGNFRYVASSPSVGLTGSASQIELSDNIELAFTSTTQLVLYEYYPISYNTTCDFDSLVLVVSNWKTEVNCYASNRTLNFRPLSSGLKPHVSLPPQTVPSSASYLTHSIGVLSVVLTTLIAL